MEWLVDLRKKDWLTQEQVAREAGISRSYYTHIERGNKTPTVRVAKKIANALGFHWTIFFLDEEDEGIKKEKGAS